MERRKIIDPRSAKNTEACVEVNDGGGGGLAKFESKMGTLIGVSVPQLTKKIKTPNTMLNCTHCNRVFCFLRA